MGHIIRPSMGPKWIGSGTEGDRKWTESGLEVNWKWTSSGPGSKNISGGVLF